MPRTHSLDRWLYRGGRAHWLARRINALTTWLVASGHGPSQVYVLEVRGRRSGKTNRFPVVVAEYAGERYLLSMLGEATNWVRNVRAADGNVSLTHGQREQAHLVEVGSGDRGEILRSYLALSPGARAHIGIAADAPAAEFERAAEQYPIFRITAPARLAA